MDTRTRPPRTYAPEDEPLDRRVVSRGPDLELWQGTVCHAVWTRDEVVGYPSFWPSVNRWLETGMREDLRHLLDGSWMTRLPPDPVRVNLPPPRVEGFGEVFRRIGDRLDGKDGAKPARIDPNPIIAPGTIRREAAVCEKCGLRYDVKFDDGEGEPLTQKPWTCDDCGGSVEVK